MKYKNITSVKNDRRKKSRVAIKEVDNETGASRKVVTKTNPNTGKHVTKTVVKGGKIKGLKRSKVKSKVVSNLND